MFNPSAAISSAFGAMTSHAGTTLCITSARPFRADFAQWDHGAKEGRAFTSFSAQRLEKDRGFNVVFPTFANFSPVLV